MVAHVNITKENIGAILQLSKFFKPLKVPLWMLCISYVAANALPGIMKCKCDADYQHNRNSLKKSY